jgi:hypothetical protein
MTLPC